MIAGSHELAPGDVVSLRFFGRDLVLFRTESGQPSLLDAYCPHLGAHLGQGGKVNGEVIQCPFHGWCFDIEGACAQVPFARKVPSKARTNAWPLVERNGLLMAFHDRNGGSPRSELPEIPELTSPDWTALVPHKFCMRTHIQEIAENVIDLAHTRFLHGMEEELTVSRFEPDNGILRFQLDGRATRMEGELHGLGFQIYRFQTDLGDGAVEFMHLIMPIPVDEEYIDWRLWHTIKRVPNEEQTKQIEESVGRYVDAGAHADLEIFQHKVYLSTPSLSDADGPIVPLRRWAEQFYG